MTYGQPDRNPHNQQTESGRVAQYHNNKHKVPPYSNVAGEREKNRGR